MKLNSLKVLLPDVYKNDRSDSFEKLFQCTANNLDYFGNNQRKSYKLKMIYLKLTTQV